MKPSYLLTYLLRKSSVRVCYCSSPSKLQLKRLIYSSEYSEIAVHVLVEHPVLTQLWVARRRAEPRRRDERRAVEHPLYIEHLVQLRRGAHVARVERDAARALAKRSRE